MPELPEVETMVRKIRGWTEQTTWLVGYDRLAGSGRYLGTGLPAGQELLGLRRVGKFIVFDLTDGTLVCHNAMSGFWDVSDEPWTFDYVEGARQSSESDVRVKLFFIRKPDLTDVRTLRFHDARKFGSLTYYGTKDDQEIPSLARVGPDALTIMPNVFMANMREHPKRTAKECLMDQGKIAGLGNIYAAEALWWARIRPDRTMGEINDDQLTLLWAASRETLRLALDRKLNYGDLKIYRRRDCPSCHDLVQKMDIKGRSTYFCGKCQS